jgi:sugar O-acyltransferase (sialic acid O-acetyltransferase NeuD family)
MKITFGLVGAGGFGREVMASVRETVELLERDERLDIYFVDASPPAQKINGVPCISEQSFIDLPAPKEFNIAIGDTKIRERVATKFLTHARPIEIRGSKVVIGDDVQIGEGAIVCPFSMITANVRIGRFFHCNIYSYVAHDCLIGDFVTFCPKVCCNGHVNIGNHVYVGTGAIIRNGSHSKHLCIGEGAIIGMGAVVTKDVPPYTTVVGNPARPMQGRS